MRVRGRIFGPATALLSMLVLAATFAIAADDGKEEVQAPVVFVTGSSTRAGIQIGPASPLGLRPDIFRAIRFASSTTKVDLAVTIDPEQADYWLFLELNEVAWARRQTWTLIVATSGIILEQDSRNLLQNALHDAVEAMGRHWFDGRYAHPNGVPGVTRRTTP